MKPKAKFDLFPGEDGQFYFNLVASNGQVIAQSEGYTRKDNALNGIASVKKNAATAKIEDRC